MRVFDFFCKSTCNENNLEIQKTVFFHDNQHVFDIFLDSLHIPTDIFNYFVSLWLGIFLGLQVEQKIYLNTKMASGKLNWGTKKVFLF